MFCKGEVVAGTEVRAAIDDGRVPQLLAGAFDRAGFSRFQHGLSDDIQECDLVALWVPAGQGHDAIRALKETGEAS